MVCAKKEAKRSKMIFIFGVLVLFCTQDAFDCLVIPQQIANLQLLFNTNIPVITKGTDSRLGWGFALGDRADFQVLVELGPQKYTQPLTGVKSRRDNADSVAEHLTSQIPLMPPPTLPPIMTAVTLHHARFKLKPDLFKRSNIVKRLIDDLQNRVKRIDEVMKKFKEIHGS